LEVVKIAHRGIFDNEKIPENTMLSIKKAVDNGYPVELDVRITADKEIVVFHDETIHRLTGYWEKVEKLDYLELYQYDLLDTKEKIPKLSAVLRNFPSHEFYIELKKSSKNKELIQKVSDLLIKHNNTQSKVISFIPFYLEYFKKINNTNQTGLSFKNHFFVRVQMFFSNIFSSVDFFLCELEALDKIKTKKEVIAWTVTNKSEEDFVLKYTNKYIFEEFK